MAIPMRKWKGAEPEVPKGNGVPYSPELEPLASEVEQQIGALHEVITELGAAAVDLSYRLESVKAYPDPDNPGMVMEERALPLATCTLSETLQLASRRVDTVRQQLVDLRSMVRL